MSSNPRLFKTLSLWQPWGSLIALGEKAIETRSWRMDYRGPLAIHAAKCKDSLALLSKSPFKDVFVKHGILSAADLPLGAVLCIVDVVDCKSTYQLRENISDQERAFGDYSAGRWGFKLANVRVFEKPIPAVGKQGMFPWTMPEGAVLKPLAEVQP